MDNTVKGKVILPAGLVPRGLSRVAAAGYVGVSPVSFDAMVRAETMPKPRRALPTNRKVWDRIELDDAIAALPHDGEDPEGTGDTWADYDAHPLQAR
jgi:hypothetical protein